MEVLTTIVARILFGAPFIIFGLFHFVKGGDMSGLIPGWMPGVLFLVYLTGLAHILAGIAIITKKAGKLASLLLALMLLIFVLMIHIPGMFNPETMEMETINTLKNFIIIGGALGYAYIFTREEALAK